MGNEVLNQILGYNANSENMRMNILNTIDSLNYTKKSENFYLIKLNDVVTALFYSIKLLAFSFLEPIYNNYFHNTRKNQLIKQIENDKTLLGTNLQTVANKVHHIVESEGLFSSHTAEEKKIACDVATATYATTSRFFAPITIDWVKSLLIRAKQQNLELVFMARDGLPAYEISKILQEANLEFRDVKTNYIYLSRAIVNGDAAQLQTYLNQQGLSPQSVENGKRLLFLDLGFYGSMTQQIRSALSTIGIPSTAQTAENKVDFEFCISTGDKAHGYVGSLDNILQSVKSAGKNRSIYWIEDTHQGTLESPKKFVDIAGTLIPNTVHENKTCRTRNELDYLCKKIALDAIKDAASVDKKIEFDATRDYSQAPMPLKNNFDDKVLHVFKNNRFLYVDHA